MARNLKDLFPPRALFEQGFQVVLKAGQGIGQGVELMTVRNSVAGQQFGVGEAADRGQVLRWLTNLQNTQGAGHFFQQTRHILQLLVIPIAFHECHVALFGLGKIGLCFLDQGIEHLAGLDLGGITDIATSAEVGDLVIERTFDVKQSSGYVEQAGFIGRLLADGDIVHGIFLFQHHTARHTEAQHAKGVGHPPQYLGLHVQTGDIAALRAHEEVKCIFDPHQIFFDRQRHGIEQGTIVTADRPLGMTQLFVGRQQSVEIEGMTQLGDAAMISWRMGGEVEQTTG